MIFYSILVYFYLKLSETKSPLAFNNAFRREEENMYCVFHLSHLYICIFIYVSLTVTIRNNVTFAKSTNVQTNVQIIFKRISTIYVQIYAVLVKNFIQSTTEKLKNQFVNKSK